MSEKTMEERLLEQIAEKDNQIEELKYENAVLFSTIESILLDMVLDEE